MNRVKDRELKISLDCSLKKIVNFKIFYNYWKSAASLLAKVP